jgi:hypothetical protein
MKSLNDYITEYQKQIEIGYIREAYRGLMEFMMNLRSHFANNYPGYLVSGNIYAGYMDMTYFSFTPESLKSRKLKIAIVFIHDKIGFEVWLAGANKQIQSQYWQLFKARNWNKYRIPSDIKGIDSIVEYDLVDNPYFDDLNTLIKQIENGTLKFTDDIVTFLAQKNPG